MKNPIVLVAIFYLFCIVWCSEDAEDYQVEEDYEDTTDVPSCDTAWQIRCGNKSYTGIHLCKKDRDCHKGHECCYGPKCFKSCQRSSATPRRKQPHTQVRFRDEEVWQSAVEVLCQLYRNGTKEQIKDSLAKLLSVDKNQLSGDTRYIRESVYNLLKTMALFKNINLNDEGRVKSTLVLFPSLPKLYRNWWQNCALLVSSLLKKDCHTFRRVHRILKKQKDLPFWESLFQVPFLIIMDDWSKVMYNKTVPKSYVESDDSGDLEVMSVAFNILSNLAFGDEKLVTFEELLRLPKLDTFNFESAVQCRYQIQRVLLRIIIHNLLKITDESIPVYNDVICQTSEIGLDDYNFWKVLISLVMGGTFNAADARKHMVQSPRTLSLHERFMKVLVLILFDNLPVEESTTLPFYKDVLYHIQCLDSNKESESLEAYGRLERYPREKLQKRETTLRSTLMAILSGLAEVKFPDQSYPQKPGFHDRHTASVYSNKPMSTFWRMSYNLVEGLPNLNSDILMKFWNPIFEIDETKLRGFDDVFRRFFVVYLLNSNDDIFGGNFGDSDLANVRSKHIFNKMQELTFLELGDTTEEEGTALVFRQKRDVSLFEKPRTRNFDDASADPYLTLFNRIYPELKKITLAQSGELIFPADLKDAFSESEYRYWRLLFTTLNSMDFQSQPQISSVFDTKSILKFKTDVRFLHMLLWNWATHGAPRVRQQSQLIPIEKVAMFDDIQPSLEFWLRIFRIAEKLMSVNYRDVTPEDINFVQNETIKGLGHREEVLRPVIAELLQRMAAIVMPEFPQSLIPKERINNAVHIQNGAFWLNLLHISRPASFPFLEGELRNLESREEHCCPDWDGVFKIYFEKFLHGLLRHDQITDPTRIIRNFLIDIPEKILSTPLELEDTLGQIKQVRNLPDLPDFKRTTLLLTLLEKLISKTMDYSPEYTPMIKFNFNDSTEDFFWKRMNNTIDKLSRETRDKMVNYMMEEPMDFYGKNIKFYYLILFNSILNYLDRHKHTAVSIFDKKNVFASRFDKVKKVFGMFERPEQFDLKVDASPTPETQDSINWKENFLSLMRWVSSLGVTVQEQYTECKLPCQKVLDSLGPLPDNTDDEQDGFSIGVEEQPTTSTIITTITAYNTTNSTTASTTTSTTASTTTTSAHNASNINTTMTPSTESTGISHTDTDLSNRPWVDFLLNKTELDMLK